MCRKLIIVYADRNIAHIKHPFPPDVLGQTANYPIKLKETACRYHLHVGLINPKRTKRLDPIIDVVCIISKLASL